MTKLLRTNGYYAAEAVKREEWHAGVCMRFVHWHYVRYYRNGDWVACYRPHPFDFWAFTSSLTPELLALAKRGLAPTIGDADPLCTAGTYTVDHDEITQTFMPESMGGKTLVTKGWVREARVAGDQSSDASDDMVFVGL